MNKAQAEAWVKELTDLLTGKELVTVAVRPWGESDVRQGQKFEKAYHVEHSDGSCVVAVCDTYGVMTGAERWTINPDRRSVHAFTTNGPGERLEFIWAIAGKDDDGTAHRAMREAQERLWRVR